jgi:hypothetical protein
MLDNTLIHEVHKFFKSEVSPNLFHLEETASCKLLKKVYEKMKELGLFNLELNNKELAEILTIISKYDASIGITLLSHYLAKEFIKKSKETPNESLIYTCELYNFENNNSNSLHFHLISGFTNKIVLPIIKNGNLSIESVDANGPHLKQVKTIGSLTSPIYQLENYQNLNYSSPGLEDLKLSYQIPASALACGLIQGTLETISKYASERTQGGKKIKEWSQIKTQLGELYMDGHITNSLFNQILNGKLTLAESLALHYKINLNLINITDNAISILGGFGYMKEYPLEKRYRDARHVSNLFSTGTRNQLIKIEKQGYHESH